MLRILPAMVGVVLLVACGVVQGLWTDRWGVSNEPRTSASKLAHVPKTIGDWETYKEPPIDETDLAVGEIAGYLDRLYLNRRTGKGLAVLCVCGKPGPIGQHPPTVCFIGAGFELTKSKRQSIGSENLQPPAEFLVGEFHKSTGTVPEWERVYWSWSGNGVWTAPESTRLAFAHYRALYKLYVIHKMSRPDENDEVDPAPDFIKLFIPELQRTLFARP